MDNTITSHNNMNHSSVKPHTVLVDNIDVHIVVVGYILDHLCLRFDRGVVHIVVAGYIVDHYCLRFDRGVVHIVVAGNIVDNYYFRFDRGVVHIVVTALLLTITV
jgi:hypothetical protein